MTICLSGAEAVSFSSFLVVLEESLLTGLDSLVLDDEDALDEDAFEGQCVQECGHDGHSVWYVDLIRDDAQWKSVLDAVADILNGQSKLNTLTFAVPRLAVATGDRVSMPSSNFCCNITDWAKNH